jgi:hypothetical protein
MKRFSVVRDNQMNLLHKQQNTSLKFFGDVGLSKNGAAGNLCRLEVIGRSWTTCDETRGRKRPRPAKGEQHDYHSPHHRRFVVCSKLTWSPGRIVLVATMDKRWCLWEIEKRALFPYSRGTQRQERTVTNNSNV